MTTRRPLPLSLRGLTFWAARGLFASAMGLVVVLAWGASSCAPSGFQDSSLLQNGVRILASSATEPYAHPGDSVGLSVLAVDGRTGAQRALSPEPMHLYWLTTLCVNPPQDAYYACFPQVAAEFAPYESDAGGAAPVDASPNSGDAEAGQERGPEGGADGAGDAGAGAEVDGATDTGGEGGTDGSLASSGPVVSRIDFSIPKGIVQPRIGAAAYGLIIKFNIACAGHLQLLPIDPSNQNPQALPIGCFSAAGQMLGPESYVFGFTRVYVYAPNDPAGPATVNHNPVITGVDTPQPTEDDGAPPATPETIAVDGGDGSPNLAAAGTFIAPLCAVDVNCLHPKIGPIVLPSSWEVAANGTHEEIWADYYATFGSFKSATRLLYDPVTGAIPGPDTEFQPPVGPHLDQLKGLLWIVVHDNRGGAAWVTIPVQLQ